MFTPPRRSALGLAGWCLVSVWLAASPALAAPRAARLMSADPAGVHFIVDVPEIAPTAALEDSTLSTLAIAGFDSDGRPGTAALPMLVVSVAVPPSGRVSVSASGSAEETRSGVRLQALPWLARAGLPEAANTSSGAAAARTASARPLARVLDVSWMRDQRVARIAVMPATWQATNGTLTVQHRIEVDVRFDAAPAAANPPADAFEEVYRDALLNYEQGRAWRRAPSAARASVSRATMLPGIKAQAATLVPDTSLYAGRLWVKVAIPSTGFYKVEFAQLLNTRLFGGRRDRPLSWIRAFTWPGLPVLPEDSYCDSCSYREVALQFVEFPTSVTNQPNKPDTLDDNREYFYFFALGPTDWGSLYDSSKPETTFVNHPYDTRNYVYVTLDSTASLPGPPLRIGTESVALSLDDTLTTPTPANFPTREHVEVDDGSQYWPDASPVVGRNPDGTYQYSGEAWEKFFWTSMTAPGGTQQQFNLPGLDPSAPVHVRVRAWGLSALVAGRDKTFGYPDHSLDMQVGGVFFPNRTWDGQTSQTYDTTAAGTQFAETLNALNLNVPKIPDPNPRHFDRIGLAWIEAYYRRSFVPAADTLVFDSDPAGGTWLYRIRPFGSTSAPRIFDVTDPLQPVELMGSQYHQLGTSSWELLFKRTESGQRRYRIVTDASFALPPTANVFDAPNSSLQNLRRLRDQHGNPVGGDFLLVYFDGFRSAADTLLQWRRYHLPAMAHAAPFDTFSVPISAIYDQFSGGRTDPSAIRNFLRAAFTYWTPRPTYVTILGNDSSDPKNLTGLAAAGMPGTLVPSYENGYDDLVQRQFATDDWLLNVDDPRVVIPDFLGGRIPARDADDAIRYVRDKLLPYERAAPLGEWRDRVMLIADDNLQAGEPDPIFWGHLQQTAALDRQGLPPELDRQYVYLHTYPDGSNHTKPLAKADIVSGLNDGVVLTNFIGHGSPYQLTDEAVFQILDAKALTNKTRQTVFVAASCDVGKFNNPDPAQQSMGEEMVLNPNGGAVVVVSATELAFSNLNGNLNLQLFQKLFSRDATTGQFETPVSLALLSAKTGLANNQKYQVMGDAAVKPALPRYYVETTLRNNQAQPDSLALRGETMQIDGRLLDRPGGSLLTYNGTCRISVEDSAPVDTVFPCFPTCITYPFRAAPVFLGDAAIQGGTFSIHFVTPMNATLGPRARVRLYDELTQGSFTPDGVGSTAFSIAPGTPPANDHEGPRITLSFRGGATSVRPGAELHVDLFDQSGILITGHTQQNGIIVTLDDDSNRRADITSTFRYAANSYQSGSASFTLPGLTPGPHRVGVSAADNLAAGIAAPEHRSTATLDFEVTQSPVLKVTRAILFPNPIRSGGVAGGGQFVIDAPGDSVNVLLKVYTVAGRLIRTLESHGGLAQVQIPWDGLDAEGEPLARGTYLFKAQVYPRDPVGKSTAQGRAEAEGKLVVVGR
jgi:hypothetical protein